MRIPIDRDNPIPVYRQVEQFLEAQISSGSLAPETRLPPSRDLASDLKVGRLTVTNAYAELQAKGLVYSLKGNGTFVSQPSQKPPSHSETTTVTQGWPQWQQELQKTPYISSSNYLHSLVDSASSHNPISFSDGCGDSSLFPLEDFRRAFYSALHEHGITALKYGDTAGYSLLRATIAQILASQGIPAFAEQILITSGSQQGINLVVRLLARPGDTIIVESPTHMGMIDLCRSLDIRMASIPVDAEGMQVDLLESLLITNRPKLIFTVPTFHNPTGACLSLPRRRQLVTLAEKYGIPILEDDYVGDLRYRGSALPALKTLDPCGNVIYLGTFSKMLVPGLRVGYLVASGPVTQSLLDQKRLSDITTSELMQRALHAYISVGRYQASLRKARQVFSRRLAAIQKSLSKHMPPGVTWNHPSGGFFIWLKLPSGLCAERLFPIAAAEGVIFAPGSFFFPENPDPTCLRLNFALHPPPLIDEGMNRLARAIRSCL